MRRGLAALLVLLGACGHAGPGPVVGNQGGTPSDAGPAARCLPLVAAQCGCVYDCMRGTPSDGRWKVTWRESVIDADVKTWCVGGQCTEAFEGDIVCDGICPPRPANNQCHLDVRGGCAGQEPQLH